jgi:S-adenosylmethionine hydrolase
MSVFHPNGIIVFLSDFGLRDAYVAEVHGAMLSRSPAARIVDATHDIPPQDIASGAFVLRRIVPAFPPGTVFLAVVDPGVGTSRHPVAALASGAVLPGDVGPALSDPVMLSFPGWTGGPRRASGSVVYVDRFGNLVLSIPADATSPSPAAGDPIAVGIGGRPVAATWGTYGVGPEACVHGDSSGYLEVAVPRGRADATLGAGVGSPVEVSW